MQGLSLELPTGYYLERDPDILTLRRSDGSVVGAFSAQGVALEAVRRTVEETASVRPSLWVRFFGHFEVLCDGEPLPLGRNGKALTILKHLLANRARPVSQDHLMGWLCPDLRIATDVEEFDGRYERGRRLEAVGRTDEANEEYARAVDLYRGDYLLEDLYEDWTMVERERLSNAFVDMLDRLAANYIESGRLGEGIGACYRALEKDRCHENSHRLLMTCYARMGQRERAIRQYRLCESILGQEYSTSPSPETRHLCQSLL